MKEIKNPLRNAKVEVRRAPPALKIVATVLILFSMAALVALRWVYNGIQQETQNLKDQAADLEYANTELTDKIADVGSVQSIQDIAQDELGLVDPDTILIDPQS